MKKNTRLTLIALLAVMLILSSVILMACSGKSDAVDVFMLDQDGKTVSEDFTLQGRIGPYKVDKDGNQLPEREYAVTWKSSNEDAIKLEKQDNGDYLAKVTMADEVQEVTLTLKCGTKKKDFTVRVAAWSASVFANAYEFAYNRKTVAGDFELDTEFKYKDKTATISWEVGNETSAQYLKIEGNKCVVTQSGMNPTVTLRATFKYNNDTASMPYRFNVYVDMDSEQLIDYWYTNTGVSVDLEGYVVAIAENDTNYSNVTFYMADKSWNAGYYVFRGGANDATHAALKVGSYVTVTGTTNTNYSGLIETNQGGTVTVDESKSVSIDEVLAHVYAVDNDIIGGVPSTIYHESQLVSLTGWTVKSVPTQTVDAKDEDGNDIKQTVVKKPDGGSNSQTLLTLTKEGVDVNVQVSGYMKGHYTLKDEQWQSIVDILDEIKVGDVVDITGILGNYMGSFQVLAVTRDYIKFETPSSEEIAPINYLTAPAEGTYKLSTYAFGAYKFVKGFAAYNNMSLTDNIAEAIDFIISKVNDTDYRIMVNGQYMELEADRTYGDVVLVDEPTEFVWKWDETLRSFTGTLSNGTFYLGQYSTNGSSVAYDDIRSSNTSFVTGDNASKIDVSQFPARYGTQNPDYVPPVTTINPGLAVAAAIKNVHELLSAESIVKLTDGDISGRYIVTNNQTFTLPLSADNDVTISYKLCWPTQFVELSGGAVTIKPTKQHERVNVRVEYKCGAYTSIEFFSIETYQADSTEIVDGEMADVLISKTLTQGQQVALSPIGTYYAGVTVQWALDKEYDGIAISGNKLVIDWVAPGAVTITLTGTFTHGEVTKTRDFTIDIPALPVIIGDVDIDFLSRFASFDKENDWTSSYQAHSVPIGADLVVDFSRADSQTGTITDRPVIAAKAGTDATVTVMLTEGGKDIENINFELKQWNTKSFQSMYLESTTDGKEWTQIPSIGFKDKGDTIDDGDFMATLGINGLDAGVIGVRLVISTNNESNVQVGLTAIKLTVRENASALKPGEGGNPDPTPTPTPGGVLARFDLGENGEAAHDDGGVAADGVDYKLDWQESNNGVFTLTEGDYTLTFSALSKFYPNARDAQGNGAIKLGTGSTAGGFTFTVPEGVKQVKLYVANYKSRSGAVVTVNGQEFTISGTSDAGVYDEITIDVSDTDTLVFLVTSGFRCMIDAIELL